MDAASELQEQGFVVISGPMPSDRMELLVDAYIVAVESATGDESDLRAEHDGQVLACGKAGSLLVFNGVRMAWPHRQRIGRATPVASRRVHSAERACRHRLLGPHATRDARAARPTCAACARALIGRPGTIAASAKPQTSTSATLPRRHELDHEGAAASCSTPARAPGLHPALRAPRLG